MRTFCKLKPSALLTRKVCRMTRVKMQHDHGRVLRWCVGVRGYHSTIAIWWLLGVSQLVAVWRLWPGRRSPDYRHALCAAPATIATIATLPHPRTGRCCCWVDFDYTQRRHIGRQPLAARHVWVLQLLNLHFTFRARCHAIRCWVQGPPVLLTTQDTTSRC